MSMTTEWNAAAHLLCVQLGSPGDVLLCTPALRALRAQCPDRKVTLLASPSGATVGPYLPDVDAVLSYEAPWMKNGMAAPLSAHLDWIATLAAQRFDGAVIFTDRNASALPAALLCRLADIPLRAAWCRDDPSGLLTHWIADPEPGAMLRHPVQRQLDLVRRLGAEIADERLAFVPTQPDLARMRTRLQAAGIDPAGRWLVLHLGAGAQARRWPQHRWSELIRALHERIACPLVLAGGARDTALIDALALPPGARVHSLAGQLGIGELGALLAQASLLLGADQGAALLAAAVGTPVVHLGASPDPQHPPWRVPGRVLNHAMERPDGQGARHHEDTDGPAPAQVADAVSSLLKQTESDRIRAAIRG
ncbi:MULTISPECIES: glycosyltransferase family 9 protein [unclassified Massilia]|uniref:glycosyltransferase family 9 protein n=1 Tax=unclassified Massilia TaxID=2609279 RepID=UPI0017842E96|nr:MULTISPECIES: glycosyltransferase family 9 protein [unclassified Massilia]MBD8530264.1 glycosyltransferase family 9 protein [Massilia sp. CFBP 13647]MBD8673041.1 glycosyltransferase family 9 protein [Massilia sp. CFBP 13721]